jgi:two-component system phosphate regulon sensor histidine kinase PhoR
MIVEGSVEVEREIAPGLPPVAADPTALEHAVQNLLSNAVKYGGEQRWLAVRAEVGAGKRGPEVRVTVEDRGPGIDPDDLPHVFEPFFRGREVLASPIHGNGLGLSLVKHIVEAHGGRVSVETEPGKGSKFTLHLPAVAEPARDRAVEGEYDEAHPAR